jgi:hypothetical protein
MARDGTRSGGRKKGTPNKKTVELISAVEESGVTPVEYMLSVMRDVANDAPVRMDAAHKVAPYIHAKLASIETKSEINATIKSGSQEVLDTLAALEQTNDEETA